MAHAVLHSTSAASGERNSRTFFNKTKIVPFFVSAGRIRTCRGQHRSRIGQRSVGRRAVFGPSSDNRRAVRMRFSPSITLQRYEKSRVETSGCLILPRRSIFDKVKDTNKPRAMPNLFVHCRDGVAKAKPKIRISRVYEQIYLLFAGLFDRAMTGGPSLGEAAARQSLRDRFCLRQPRSRAEGPAT